MEDDRDTLPPRDMALVEQMAVSVLKALEPRLDTTDIAIGAVKSELRDLRFRAQEDADANRGLLRDLANAIGALVQEVRGYHRATEHNGARLHLRTEALEAWRERIEKEQGGESVGQR